MSFIDAFYYIKSTDAQGCRDHHKNMAKWMLKILEPDLRDLLTKAHLLSKFWKRGRSASAIIGTNDPSPAMMATWTRASVRSLR